MCVHKCELFILFVKLIINVWCFNSNNITHITIVTHLTLVHSLTSMTLLHLSRTNMLAFHDEDTNFTSPAVTTGSLNISTNMHFKLNSTAEHTFNILNNSSLHNVSFDIGTRSMETDALQDVANDNATELLTLHGSPNTFDPCAQIQINNSHCRMIVEEFQATDHWFSQQSEAILIACYCVAITLGIAGNSIVCYIVLKFKHLQRPRNILILNLSVCGLLMCVACMPFSLIRLTLKNWHLGGFLCRMSPSLQTIDVFVSTFTIVAIAVDRYSAIVCASRDDCNRKLVYYGIVLIWLCSILLCIPMMVFHEVHEIYPQSINVQLYTICMEVWPSPLIKKVYTTFVLVFQYAAPLAIISALHGRICQFLRVRINGNPRTDREVERVLRELRRQRRNMLLLTAIAVLFAISWLPLTVLNTLADYDYRLFLNKNFNQAYAYCLLAAMCSACLNPIIYGWFNTNFRKAFLQVICSIRHTGSNPTEMATIKNDSKGNSQQPFRFYSSLQLDFTATKSRSISSKSGSLNSPLPKVLYTQQVPEEGSDSWISSGHVKKRHLPSHCFLYSSFLQHCCFLE